MKTQRNRMSTIAYNHTVLLGQVTNGLWRNLGVEGKAESAAFGLAIPEPGKDGQTYNTFVRCECYGRTVAHALALRQGDTVLVEGKLSWQRGAGEGKGALGVIAWRLLPLASDQPMTGELTGQSSIMKNQDSRG